jgi:hypothetical protein
VAAAIIVRFALDVAPSARIFRLCRDSGVHKAFIESSNGGIAAFSNSAIDGLGINPYTNMLSLHVRGTVVVADAHDYLKL